MYGAPRLLYHKVTVKVKCVNDTCDNILSHEYIDTDYSPRIDGSCTVCGAEYSVKLSKIEESKIIDRTREKVWEKP